MMWQRSSVRSELLRSAATNGDGCAAVEVGGWSESLFYPSLSGLSLFVPEGYESGYGYPLICYLHDDGRSEEDLWSWFPGISEKNLLAVGVRAPFPNRRGIPGSYFWRGQRPDASFAAIRDAIESIQEQWCVHPQRVVLMGEGRGALIALQQFLLRRSGLDDSLANIHGIICGGLPPCWSRFLPHIADAEDGRILFLDHFQDGEACAAVDSLGEAGFAITFADEFDRPRAGAINHWLMHGIATAIF